MKDLLTHKHPTEINVLFVASLYQWSEAMQLLTVFTVFQTLNSIWGGGKEKRKKVHFRSCKSLVDLINLIVLGIFDIPSRLHTAAATCCHLKSKYRITAN